MCFHLYFLTHITIAAVRPIENDSAACFGTIQAYVNHVITPPTRWVLQLVSLYGSGRNLKITYHTFLGLIIAFGSTTSIGLQACMLKIPLIILT